MQSLLSATANEKLGAPSLKALKNVFKRGDIVFSWCSVCGGSPTNCDCIILPEINPKRIEVVAIVNKDKRWQRKWLIRN